MIPTPHIEASNAEKIAKTVLMPGDPLRAKFIADSFLEGATQFNGVRGMLGFTGRYKGKDVSVMGSGMGIPSMGIYAYELFKFYDVENIIRVGTAGGIAPHIGLRDIVIAQGACTDSAFMNQYGLGGTFAPLADYALLEAAVKSSRNAGKKTYIGNVLTSDVFYGDGDISGMENWRKMGVLAVEMEAAGLYATAARLGKKALAIITVSDLVFTHEQTTSQERQEGFMDMVKIALDAQIDIR
ncbi:MAG: purine-nucleoside phosphorylase [Defluviitaleaceae bacterium]|nr:purine-nucleoside phosphorylase [Defluviitaleaceae bacterium]